MRLGACYSIPDHFIAELQAYDPKLRVRWGRAEGKVRVERKVRRASEPTLLINVNLLSPKDFDDFEMMRDGYSLAITPFAPLAHNWPKMAYTVAVTDLQRLGGARVVADELESREAHEKERRSFNRRSDYHEMGCDLYRHMNRIATAPEGATNKPYGSFK